jgi:2-oxoglutarate ferredoxin oxidoreductase subunit alpha
MNNKTEIIELEKVVIKFSGDSGDGMQLTGMQFSETSALMGNEVSTFPDYPAEIRAPQGTVGGVSGFQLHFGNIDVNTPGDYADVLVAMNPAALKANLRWIKSGGTIIVDIDSFTEKNLEKAECKENPLENDMLHDFHVISAPITSLTKESLKDLELDIKSVLRTKNMFALGMVYWLFNRELDYSHKYFEKKFNKVPVIVEANTRVLDAGYNYALNLQLLRSYRVPKANIKKGTYRNINGNTATAWGLLAAAEKAGLQLFLGSYPITPATEILQEIAVRKDLGAISFQAEDEIGGIVTAIGAAFSGKFACTSTSGPGLALKSEAIGLAVIAELPLVIVNVQRGGPSTGLPTKTEQSDLLQALYGRNGESPCVVIAVGTPGNCFKYAYIAGKIALEHMTPVILLTDGFIANGSMPWRIPKMSELEDIKLRIVKEEQKIINLINEFREL